MNCVSPPSPSPQSRSIPYPVSHNKSMETLFGDVVGTLVCSCSHPYYVAEAAQVVAEAAPPSQVLFLVP